ncbi:hypothetical protein ACFL96_00940 [Thermoproteota archaeon]
MLIKLVADAREPFHYFVFKNFNGLTTEDAGKILALIQSMRSFEDIISTMWENYSKSPLCLLEPAGFETFVKLWMNGLCIFMAYFNELANTGQGSVSSNLNPQLKSGSPGVNTQCLTPIKRTIIFEGNRSFNLHLVGVTHGSESHNPKEPYLKALAERMIGLMKDPSQLLADSAVQKEGQSVLLADRTVPKQDAHSKPAERPKLNPETTIIFVENGLDYLSGHPSLKGYNVQLLSYSPLLVSIRFILQDVRHIGIKDETWADWESPAPALVNKFTELKGMEARLLESNARIRTEEDAAYQEGVQQPYFNYLRFKNVFDLIRLSCIEGKMNGWLLHLGVVSLNQIARMMKAFKETNTLENVVLATGFIHYLEADSLFKDEHTLKYRFVQLVHLLMDKKLDPVWLQPFPLVNVTDDDFFKAVDKVTKFNT